MIVNDGKCTCPLLTTSSDDDDDDDDDHRSKHFAAEAVSAHCQPPVTVSSLLHTSASAMKSNQLQNPSVHLRHRQTDVGTQPLLRLCYCTWFGGGNCAVCCHARLCENTLSDVADRCVICQGQTAMIDACLTLP